MEHSGIIRNQSLYTTGIFCWVHTYLNSMIEIAPELWPRGHCLSAMSDFFVPKSRYWATINKSMLLIFQIWLHERSWSGCALHGSSSTDASGRCLQALRYQHRQVRHTEPWPLCTTHGNFNFDLYVIPMAKLGSGVGGPIWQLSSQGMVVGGGGSSHPAFPRLLNCP